MLDFRESDGLRTLIKTSVFLYIGSLWIASSFLKCVIDVTYLFHTAATDRKLLTIQQESKILAVFANWTLGVEMKKAYNVSMKLLVWLMIFAWRIRSWTASFNRRLRERRIIFLVSCCNLFWRTFPTSEVLPTMTLGTVTCEVNQGFSKVGNLESVPTNKNS